MVQLSHRQAHVTDTFRFPLFQTPSSAQEFARTSEILAQVSEARSAEGFVKRLLREIRAFEFSLDPAHEVGIRLVSFGQALTFHVTRIGFVEPSLITFHGLSEAREPVQLVQHVNQISFLLMKVERLEPETPKQPIGFSSGTSEG
jgi:hypothetical protein